MFPVPFFAAPVTDVAGTAAVVEGYTDNVNQARGPNDVLIRHPALFTGLDGSFTLRVTSPNTDEHSLRAFARAQFYQSLDNTPGSPDGTAALSWMSQVHTGKRTALHFSLGSTLSRVTSARIGDGTLLYSVDPTTTQALLSISTGSFSVVHDLSDRWRYRFSTGAVVNGTVDTRGPLTIVQGGGTFDPRGINGIQPFVTTSLARAIDDDNAVDVAVTYRYLYAPYSLDFSTSPPRLGGAQRAHQFVPDVGLSHTFTPEWFSITRAGLAFSTASPFDTNQGLVALPVASEEVHYTTDRMAFIGLAGVSYGAVTPHLGSGPSFSAGGSLIGSPFRKGALGKMVMLAAAGASRSSLAASSGGFTTLGVLGAGIQVRYPLTQNIGILTGYDVHRSTLAPPASDDPAAPTPAATIFVRQIVFIGISGYWTTDGAIPPLQSFAASTRPG